MTTGTDLVQTVKLEQHHRSILKAISWRILGTCDTFVLSWLLTGQVHLAGAIASTEVVTKIGLFYFHERLWARVNFGYFRLRP